MKSAFTAIMNFIEACAEARFEYIRRNPTNRWY